MSQKFSNVLIVDDSVTVRITLEKALTEAGYDVRTAVNGIEALKSMQEQSPDYVITDWQMPNMNGHALCRCIREAERQNYVYIVLMTGYSDMLNLVDGLGAGADDYITTPVDVRELLARMQAGSRVLDLDRRLNHIARHDPLTGVLNRRDLVATVNRLIELSHRRNRKSASIMVDLDHFKAVNDKHGHLAGDAVLVQVAKMLKEEFRSADFVCRYGGEEFIVILPECDEAEAQRCAERCRANIESGVSIDGIDDLSVTASFGVADTSEDGALELVNRVDAALFQAKRRGRNCVVRFSELDPSEHLNSNLPSLLKTPG